MPAVASEGDAAAPTRADRGNPKWSQLESFVGSDRSTDNALHRSKTTAQASRLPFSVATCVPR
jgi:hypothetical protein